MENIKKLYIVTGFLGAGKTTFVKNLFQIFKDRKIAVIVNEFGKEGIDGLLLSKEGISIAQINNGSIFCVCRSDLFIDTLAQACKQDVELIIVETSGLADPTDLPNILEVAQRITNNSFVLKGTIAIIDAVNINKVLKTALACERQIRSADLLLINKTDLVDKEEIDSIKETLKIINSRAGIEETSFGLIKDVKWVDELESSDNEELKKLIKIKIIGQQKLFVKMEDEYILNNVQSWINTFKDNTYRIKGFIKTKEAIILIDGVNGNISYTNTVIKPEIFGIVILASGSQPVKNKVTGNWSEFFINEIILE